jgi:hypothetical protein
MQYKDSEHKHVQYATNILCANKYVVHKDYKQNYAMLQRAWTQVYTKVQCPTVQCTMILITKKYYVQISEKKKAQRNTVVCDGSGHMHMLWRS